MRKLKTGEREHQERGQRAAKTDQLTWHMTPRSAQDRCIKQQRPWQKCPKHGMKIKKRIAATLDRASVEEPAELTIPEKKANTAHVMMTIHQLLRMKIELLIQADQLGQHENSREHDGQPPADLAKLLPFPTPDPVE